MLEILNNYAHGYVAVPVIIACKKHGLFELLDNKKSVGFSVLVKELNANSGHLRVALNMLQSLGWMTRSMQDEYALTHKASIHAKIPGDITDLLSFPMEEYLKPRQRSLSLGEWFDLSKKNWNISEPLIAQFIDGMLIIPLLLSLKGKGLLEDSGKTSKVLFAKLSAGVRRELTDFFLSKGWLSEASGAVEFTDPGRFITGRIFITATVASYKPMLARISEVIFGDCKQVFQRDDTGHESHVDRTMNVIGSGFQHEKYFSDMEEIILSLFNLEPYDTQPKYIADMGCGDGTLLKKVYEIIKNKTSRGNVLKEYPLKLIGVDYNEKALTETHRTLEGIDHLVLKGDIGDPGKMIFDLKDKGIKDTENILHIRSFLDHDRPYIPPREVSSDWGFSSGQSNDVYVDGEGKEIPADMVFQSLKEHLGRWTKILTKHGMIILEVHSLAPEIINKYIDKCENLHFDAYHRFARQLLVNADKYVMAAAQEGLFPEKEYSGKYPKILPYSRITLNYFKKRDYIVRHPDAKDISALVALEEGLLPAALRSSYEQIAERIEQYPEGQFIMEIENNISGVVYSQRIFETRMSDQREAMGNIPWRHTEDGPVIQLMYMVYSEPGQKGRGAEFLDFVELLSELKNGIEEVMGKSRCISFMRDVSRDTCENYRIIIDYVKNYASSYPIASGQDSIHEETELEEFGARWLVAILQNMGVMKSRDEKYSVGELVQKLKILPKYEKLFHALLKILERKNLLDIKEQQVHLKKEIENYALKDIESQCKQFEEEFIRKYPEFMPFQRLMYRCMDRFAEVLTGEEEANDVVFPEGSMELFSGIFYGNSVADYFNRLTTEVIYKFVESEAAEGPESKITILEIGAGTGGTTKFVLEKLQPYGGNLEYYYTDISSTFARHGKKVFGQRFPWIRFDRLNIEEDPMEQGFLEGYFDVVFASNVLHDTKYLKNTLTQVKKLLKNGGILVLNEFTRMKDLLLFTGGLLHGWWLFEDTELRLEDTCLLSVEHWKNILESSGFEDFEAYGLPYIKEKSDFRQSVIVCRLSRDAHCGLLHSKAGVKLPASEEAEKPEVSDVKEPVHTGASIDNIIRLSLEKIIGEKRYKLFASDVPIMEAGLDSLELLELKTLLSKKLGMELNSSFFFRYNTIDKITEYLSQNYINTEQEEPQQIELDVASLLHGNTTGAVNIRENTVKSVETTGIEAKSEEITHLIRQSLKKILGEKRFQRFLSDTPLMEAGLDSLELLEFKTMLSKKLSMELSSTFFFQYNTIDKITRYLEKNLKDNDPTFPYDSSETRGTCLPDNSSVRLNTKTKPGDVAVIGMAFRFPGGIQTREELWDLLVQGQSAVGQMPDHRVIWPRDVDIKGKKSYLSRGGFLPEIDKFDASFFRISPKEAELMDPQQRMLLELSWEVMEDAGYKPSDLCGGQTGVYLGACHFDYRELLRKSDIPAQTYLATGTSGSIFANRLSYFYDFIGPSILVDTACSSSLVAVHKAVGAIRNGECTQAMAGGVNLICSPTNTLAYDHAGMLSGDGKCYTFDDRANGYVRGEGGALVLLKSLDAAVRDNDSIYAVIKGSAINHGGKASSLTAPNPEAQAKVIKSAVKDAEISPDTISYVEAHGTGTSLGDPIEVEGLNQALTHQNSGVKMEKYCGLGSVKTNLGHLEGAAGIAGFIKVVLSMKNKTIPATINYRVLNKEINLGRPFYIADETKEWQRMRDGEGHEIPRRAGVSAFGFGGANAHVVLEEYPVEADSVKEKSTGPYVVTLSAKNAESLGRYVKKFINYISVKTGKGEKLYLENIAYTFQTGREAMNRRLAIVAWDMEDLLVKMRKVDEGQKEIDGVYFDHYEGTDTEACTGFIKSIDKELISTCVDEKNYEKLAELWALGITVDWNRFYNGTRPGRIGLPTYEFVRERFWIPETDRKTDSQINEGSSFLHPLLHKNTSVLSEQRFSSTFTGKESFLTDHVVNNEKILPGVAYLEMALAAVGESLGVKEGSGSAISLKNIVWTRPIIVRNQPQKVHIGLFPQENGEIEFEIYSLAEDNSGNYLVHCRGYAAQKPAGEIPFLDIETVKGQCNRNTVPADRCYEVFRTCGLNYGRSHQGIAGIFQGDGQVLAKLALSPDIQSEMDQFILYPGMMDSALQATVIMEGVFGKPALPFTLDGIDIFGRCTGNMWASVRRSVTDEKGKKIEKYHIDLCDDRGAVCVSMKGLLKRIPEVVTKAGNTKDMDGILLACPSLKEKAALSHTAEIGYADHIAILIEFDGISREGLENLTEGVCCFNFYSEEINVEERFGIYALQLLEQIRRVIQDKDKGNLLIQVIFPDMEQRTLFKGLAGLLKTAHLENSRLTVQIIGLDSDEVIKGIAEKIMENSQNPQDFYICYKYGKRYVREFEEVQGSDGNIPVPWKNQGVYLITGGLGNLGLIFADEIIGKTQGSTLVLTGRSALSGEKQKRFEKLKSQNAVIEYKQADISSVNEVESLISEIIKNHGRIDGIIHSAGVVQDNFIYKKSSDEYVQVLAPKVSGTVNLDRACKGLTLDFFILFSSVAAILGNQGQGDYSAANAFMDAYAEYRNSLVEAGSRSGRTISMNWPLWEEGGMYVDEETKKLMRRNAGMGAMQTSNGIAALYRALDSGYTQMAVVEGNVQRIREKLCLLSGLNVLHTESVDEKEIDQSELTERIIKVLVNKVSKILKVKIEDIDINTSLNDYGFDSITFTEFANTLNEEYDTDLTPAVFFEYPTVSGFAGYLAKECWTQFVSGLSIEESTHTEVKSHEMYTEEPNAKRRKRFINTPDSVTVQNAFLPDGVESNTQPIAVVGMSCKFPMAQDINEFWKNLSEGRDCITEVPKDRWDWEKFYGDPSKEENKTNIKWGGFIEGIDEFDPLFFGISPKEAELMDPQQRLLLTYAWKAIEDAGYSPRSLSGTKTGVFMGVMNSGYDELAAGAGLAIEGYSATSAVPSVGPNRISYFLNLHGPSEAVETACSSSLVAVNHAIAAILDGTCDMALAGGVNVILTPDYHISFNKAGMLSRDGRCKTFSDKADGYVRSEGIGIIFLKKLSDAERCGDHIYGIIKGSAVNHGGRANSLTSPNPNAQAEVLITAYRRAGVDPATVGYIETHGTGTALGDPVESNGLKAAFKELYRSAGKSETVKVHCGLGSVKTNMGHLEVAAGVAGLMKAILQLKYKTLVKNLHCENINPYIHLDGSPFYIVRESREWEAMSDSQGRNFPRIAGVSSFGFGGTNAHVVLEEYVPVQPPVRVNGLNTAVIVLSGKTRESLIKQAEQLLYAVNEEYFSQDKLFDVAYTLQIGREAMEERLAFTAASMEELKQKLMSFIGGEPQVKDIYSGQARRNKESMSVFDTDEDLQSVIETWITKKKFSKILELWVGGLDFDWNRLYKDCRPSRISLPTYPFAREHYWIPGQVKAAGHQTKYSFYREKMHHHIDTSEDMDDMDWEKGRENLFYLPVWQAQPPLVRKKYDKYKGVAVVCSEMSAPMGKTIYDYYRKNRLTEKVILIKLDCETKKISENEWSCDANDPEALDDLLTDRCGLTLTDCVYFLSDCRRMEKTGENYESDSGLFSSEIHLLRLAKSIKQRNSGNNTIDFYIITQDSYRISDTHVNPYAGGINGFAYAVAQGDYRLAVRNIDISLEDIAGAKKREALARLIIAEKPSAQGEVVKYHGGIRYKQRFIKNDSIKIEAPSGIRDGGTYIILGGSGTLGSIITRHLIKEYNAKVVWLGRRPEESLEIQRKLASFDDVGQRPLYIKADVLNRDEVAQAVKKVKEQYTEIHGAVFSGLVFNLENSIEQLKEEEFKDVYYVKARGSVNFYSVLKDEPLDFMCFFSSVQAFAFNKAVNSSAYASGITFSDAFVRFVQSKSGFPVGCINWGFWKSSLNEEWINGDMPALEDYEGAECFDNFITMLRQSNIRQIACCRISETQRELMDKADDETIHVYQAKSDPIPQDLWKTLTNKEKQPDAVLINSANDQLDDWLAKILCAKLNDMGLFANTHKPENTPLQAKPELITGKYQRWLEECLNILKTKGYISFNEDKSQMLLTYETEKEELAGEWNEAKQHYLGNDDLKAKVSLADACLEKLPEILTGKISATRVVFPESSMEKVEGIYKDNTQSDYFNSVVADVVEAYVIQRIKSDPAAKVSIIEAGAGTGATSIKVLDRLKPYAGNIDYCYTDISKAFLLHGEEKYGDDFPCLRYTVWDVEKPIKGQQIQAGEYDIAIATNIIHATKNIRNSIRNIKAAIKTNGILVINEATQKSLFALLTFGLLDGWWLYEDNQLRIPGSPLLPEETWQRVLAEEGFMKTHLLAGKDFTVGQQVICGESNGIVRQSVSGEFGRKDVSGSITESDRNRNKKEELPLKAAKYAGTEGKGYSNVVMNRSGEFLPDKSVEKYIKTCISDTLSQTLKVPENSIDNEVAFSDYGVDSITGVNFIKTINNTLELALNTSILYDYPTIDTLTGYILKRYKEQIKERMNSEDSAYYGTQTFVKETDHNYDAFLQDLENKFMDNELSTESLIDILMDSFKNEG